MKTLKWVRLPDNVPDEEEGVYSLFIAGRKICLVHHAGKRYATAARCPHAGADLTQGWCQNGKLVCPFHRRKYSLETGRGDEGQGDYIRVYPLEKRSSGWFVGLPLPWWKRLFFFVFL